MRYFMDLLNMLNDRLIGNAVPVSLFFMGILYLFYLRAFYIRHPVRVLTCMIQRDPDRGKGKTSPLRAMMLALAGTLGVGNLVGVAGAIMLGGAGAVFWMLLSAFLAMLLKYAETVLALRYRSISQDGRRCGGAMYYISACFSHIGFPRIGIAIASVFAVFCVVDSFTMGSIIQMNAVGSAFRGIFGWSPAIVGAVLSLTTLSVIWGGGKRISAMTERLVPLMTLIYLILSLAVLILKREEIPAVFQRILKDAFSFQSALSGIGGFCVTRAMRYGTLRGLMSNEAGCGTSPIAHAESDEQCPAVQGLWGIFEVFADTIVLCTLTAVVILISYDSLSEYYGDAMMLTVKSYSYVLGEWCEPVFAILVLFFAFATVICRAHYGRSAIGYLTDKRIYHSIYMLLFSGSVWIGTVSAPDAVWTVADFALGIMTLLNIAVLWMMRKEVKAETNLLLGR